MLEIESLTQKDVKQSSIENYGVNEVVNDVCENNNGIINDYYVPDGDEVQSDYIHVTMNF